MKYTLLTAILALAFAAVTLANGPRQAPKGNKAAKHKGPPNTAKIPNTGKIPNTCKVPDKGKNTGKIQNNSLEPGETKKTQENPFHHEAQKKSNQALIHAFHVLQSTSLLLQKGDHDYGGHRVNAIKSIGAAQGELRLALGKYGKNIPPAAAAKDGAGKEAQKKSNAQLNHAIKTVQSTITHLANANYDYYGHRYKAVVALEGTLKQLQLALKFAK